MLDSDSDHQAPELSLTCLLLSSLPMQFLKVFLGYTYTPVPSIAKAFPKHCSPLGISQCPPAEMVRSGVYRVTGELNLGLPRYLI